MVVVLRLWVRSVSPKMLSKLILDIEDARPGGVLWQRAIGMQSPIGYTMPQHCCCCIGICQAVLNKGKLVCG
jgi:hypothetical protein